MWLPIPFPGLEVWTKFRGFLELFFWDYFLGYFWAIFWAIFLLELTLSQISENVSRTWGMNKVSGVLRSPQTWCIIVKTQSLTNSELLSKPSKSWPYWLITSVVANLKKKKVIMTHITTVQVQFESKIKILG